MEFEKVKSIDDLLKQADFTKEALTEHTKLFEQLLNRANSSTNELFGIYQELKKMFMREGGKTVEGLKTEAPPIVFSDPQDKIAVSNLLDLLGDRMNTVYFSIGKALSYLQGALKTPEGERMIDEATQGGSLEPEASLE